MGFVLGIWAAVATVLTWSVSSQTFSYQCTSDGDGGNCGSRTLTFVDNKLSGESGEYSDMRLVCSQCTQTTVTMDNCRGSNQAAGDITCTAANGCALASFTFRNSDFNSDDRQMICSTSTNACYNARVDITQRSNVTLICDGTDACKGMNVTVDSTSAVTVKTYDNACSDDEPCRLFYREGAYWQSSASSSRLFQIILIPDTEPPTMVPSLNPTQFPTLQPTMMPTLRTYSPTDFPSSNPTTQPTSNPTTEDEERDTSENSGGNSNVGGAPIWVWIAIAVGVCVIAFILFGFWVAYLRKKHSSSSATLTQVNSQHNEAVGPGFSSDLASSGETGEPGTE